jgi:hypothetical protein
VETELFSVLDVTTNPNIDVESLKAFGIACLEESSYKFKPSLKKTEIAEEGKEVVTEMPALRLGLLLGLAAAGIVAAILFSVFLTNEQNTFKYEVERIDKGIIRPAPLKGLSSKQIEDINKAEDKKVKIFKDLAKSSKIASALEKVSNLRPKGLWFEAVDASCKKDKCIILIDGNIFLGDPYKERASIDEFVSSLKNDSVIKSNFSNADMTSSEKKSIGEFTLTRFSVKIE